MKIFISYNHNQEAIVKDLDNNLEVLGHDVWYDQDLIGGSPWWDKILEEIRKCDVFIFLLDQMSVKSKACNSELRYATALGRNILPVLVAESVSVINRLPENLVELQFEDYMKRDEKAILKLARAIYSFSPSKPLPDPLPIPPEMPLSSNVPTVDDSLGIPVKELGFLKLLIPLQEKKHLLNLEQGRTANYKGRGSLRSELRHLFSIGLIQKHEGKHIADMKSSMIFNLDDYVELTELGKTFIQYIR